MEKIFAATQHYVMIILRHKKITFPTTKQEILAKAGKESVRIDWDMYVTLSEYCKNVKLDTFTTKAAFFNAILGSNTIYDF
ncbi:unnamed protein product [Commensalibacter communis]|uniref:hypothetical protein n=1 Tax=Commensalibacter communis TaxID=2972786 RepID=UPI0022FF75E6|nr:hypothetical protein [Commensalibacter communis]CAI3929504.1 unnamed protein product [Commensalibacter communis]CAI3929778.1 unnamed protein product [Commensalibacter communis]